MTFAPGDLSETLTIDTLDDNAYENNESLVVTLASLNGAAGNIDGTNDVATGTIINTTLGPTYAISGAPSVDAGGTLTFTVTRNTDDETEAATVSYSLSGTATSGADYVAPTGSVTFATGSLSQTVTVQTLNDNLYENTSVVVTLTSLNGVAGGIDGNNSAATGTIVGTAPAPTIASQVLAHDTGASSTDRITSDGNVTLAGTVAAGSTVTLVNGSTVIGAATVTGTSWTFSTDLAQGTYGLQALATDADGGTAESAAAPTIVVDQTAPVPVVASMTPSGTKVTLTGTAEANDPIAVLDGATQIGTTTADGTGAWTFTTGTLTNVLHTFSVTATDVAGNVGTSSGVAQFGSTGNDTLAGTAGADIMVGGKGNDTYIVNNPGDVVTESAGGGTDTVETTLASYTLPANVENLVGIATTPQVLTGNTLANTITAGPNGGDTLIAGAGADTLISGANGNTLEAGTGATTVVYAANGLAVNLVTGTAAINGAGTGDTLIGITRVSVTGNNDTLTADGSTDTLTATGNNDTLVGGTAASTLTATGSGDTLIGGTGATTLISNAGGNTLQAGSGKAIAAYTANGLAVNLATGTAGINGSGISDTLVGIVDVTVHGNNDTLIADGSADTLTATGNDDTLTGGTAASTLTATGSGNTLTGGSGPSTLISNAGGNTLIAGTGVAVAQYSVANLAVNLAAGTASVTGSGIADTLIGITDVTVSGTGDTVTGDANADTLAAKGKSETLVAGSGGGTLTTTSSSDLLVGGAGMTTLVSNANGNTLQAGSGQTVASYALSSLAVDLGAGTATHAATGDTLIGITDVTVTGTGDTLTAGAANETLAEHGSTSTLTASSAGHDTLDVASGSSDILIATVAGNALIGDGSNTTVDYTGSGLTIDLATGTAKVNATGVTDTLSGITSVVVSGNNDTLIADGGTDTLAAIGTGDTLIGGTGTTTLIGAAAGDTLEAGTGKAIASYAANNLAVNLATGSAQINGSGTSDALIGIATVTTSGTNDTLTAGSGTDSLTASGAGATLIAGSGADRLADSGTGGLYQFASGDGNATIVNSGSGKTSASNALAFGSGLSDQNLWFVQSGNNLQIDLMGTKTHVTISGWFSSAANQTQEITAGGLEIDSQVSQLVQAMASYSAANPGFNPTTATQAPNDPTLQSTIASAWHH